MDILDFLNANEIAFQRIEHSAVFTCAEADDALSNAAGARTKNLFLRDERAQRHFLVMTRHTKRVDLQKLGEVLKAKRLGFASAERLSRYLGVEPGAVTILGLINDSSKQVEVLIDEELWQEDLVHCHPLVNTSTLIISTRALEKLCGITGHSLMIANVPEL